MLYTDGVKRGERIFNSLNYKILERISKGIPILQLGNFLGEISLGEKNEDKSECEEGCKIDGNITIDI